MSIIITKKPASTRRFAPGALILLALLFLMLLPQQAIAAQINEASRKYYTDQLLSVEAVANMKEITRLIQEGADVNAFDRNGFTPLMIAAEKNTNPEVIRILIENGADVNATVRYIFFGDKTKYIERLGYTPWMLAVRYNPNPEVLRVLIENGADVNSVDIYGYTPLMLAAEKNAKPEVTRFLIERGANVNAISRVKKLSTVQTDSGCGSRFIIFGPRYKTETEHKIYTPLIAATYNSNPGIAQVLIDNGASGIIAKLLQIANKVLDNKFMIILSLLLFVFIWIPGKRRIKKFERERQEKESSQQ